MAWKKSKGRYNIKPKGERTYKGIVYDSGFEMAYAQNLDLKLKAGVVLKWDRQVRYDIVVNSCKIGFYKLDFLVTYNDGTVEHIDCKSTPKMVDSTYKLKKKLIKALYDIDIKEVFQKP
jgi:hypothetical protein